MFFVNKMFLHCFSQRHVSSEAMNHLQVYFAKKKVINLKMIH